VEKIKMSGFGTTIAGGILGTTLIISFTMLSLAAISLQSTQIQTTEKILDNGQRKALTSVNFINMSADLLENRIILEVKNDGKFQISDMHLVDIFIYDEHWVRVASSNWEYTIENDTMCISAWDPGEHIIITIDYNFPFFVGTEHFPLSITLPTGISETDILTVTN